MKITMYGTEICPDCVKDKALLTNNPDIELDYRNITESTATLKEFLAFRDKEDMFEEVKAGGRIGIPFFILENGEKTFDISGYVEKDSCDTVEAAEVCSLDKPGQC